jgi:hypothetical protein
MPGARPWDDNPDRGWLFVPVHVQGQFKMAQEVNIGDLGEIHRTCRMFSGLIAHNNHCQTM